LAFSYWFDKPRFLIEGKLADVLITPCLGVPNCSVIYINTATTIKLFLASLPGKKKISARGVSHAHPLLCFSVALLYFCLHRFIKNTKKIVSL
jgi:hypothetical protein